MNQKTNDLQTRLLRYYSEQLQRYERLDAAVQELQRADNDSTEVLIHVREILSEISNCDDRHAALRTEWASTEGSASPELKATVKRVTDRIERVIGQVSQSELQAREAQQKLMPQISAEAARRKVAAAYGGH